MFSKVSGHASKVLDLGEIKLILDASYRMLKSEACNNR